MRSFWAAGISESASEAEIDGRTVRLRLRRLPSRTGWGGTVVVLEDITDKLRSARVLAWGEMARQVAHEIKNPLTPIKLSVQHLRRAFLDGRADYASILDNNVEAVLSEIDRLGEIARAFARFGTPAASADPVEAVDLGRIVSETLALYRGGGDGIDYSMDVAPAVGRVLSRTGELKEVLVNLLENAREASPSDGEIAVTARRCGEQVDLRVRDSGVGMEPEVLARIFEPQFSTRTSGTGLGLAIVQRLVSSWGAQVAATSAPGKGTEVVMRLLAADDGVPPPPAD